MSEELTAADLARALMGPTGIKPIVPKAVRPEKCAGCPFQPDLDAWTTVKAEVLKRELREHPKAGWMCHETAGGGHHPTEKSLLCAGFLEWHEAGRP